MPIVTVCAVSLLVGLALGLRTNVRGLMAAIAVAAVVGFAASLYTGGSIGSSIVLAVAVVVLVQVGYFAAILLDAITGFDKRIRDSESHDGVPDPDATDARSKVANESFCDPGPNHRTTSARGKTAARTEAD